MEVGGAWEAITVAATQPAHLDGSVQLLLPGGAPALELGLERRRSLPGAEGAPADPQRAGDGLVGQLVVPHQLQRSTSSGRPGEPSSPTDPGPAAYSRAGI